MNQSMKITRKASGNEVFPADLFEIIERRPSQFVPHLTTVEVVGYECPACGLTMKGFGHGDTVKHSYHIVSLHRDGIILKVLDNG